MQVANVVRGTDSFYLMVRVEVFIFGCVGAIPVCTRREMHGE